MFTVNNPNEDTVINLTMDESQVFQSGTQKSVPFISRLVEPIESTKNMVDRVGICEGKTRDLSAIDIVMANKGVCKGNLMIKHDAQILARGIQSILDKYNTVEGCIPCKGDPKRKL